MNKCTPVLYLAISTAVWLTACGGGGGGGTPPATPDTPVLTTFNGAALKGPLNNALVCADENDNGKCDAGEPSTRTSSDGSGSFTLKLAKAVPLLVTTDADTKDDRGNPLTPGTVLKAPAGSSVVSVATTMIKAGASNEQVAKALGYTTGTDFTTLNPFKTGGVVADQYKFETAAMQVYTAISAIASGASSTGADVNVAFDSAFKAMAETSKTATQALDFTDKDVIDGIAGKAATTMIAVSGFDAVKFAAARKDLKDAVANVNTAIKAVSQNDFKNPDTNSLYSVAVKNLSDQMTSRVKDDTPVTLADTSNISAILTEQKTAATAPVAKISDMVGFWEGSIESVKVSTLVLSDGTAWMVTNETAPKIMRAALKVNGGMASGGADVYTYGASNKSTLAMTAAINQGNLAGVLTYAKDGTFQRANYSLGAANTAKKAAYSKAATLAAMATKWTATISGQSFEWTFSSAGVLSGVNLTTGCTYTGPLSLRSGDSSAIMNASITEQCDGSAATLFTGIAYINENNRPQFVLISNSRPVLLSF